MLLLYIVDVSGQTQNPALAMTQNPQSDDFDMFAQSRKSFDQNRDNLRWVKGVISLILSVLQIQEQVSELFEPVNEKLYEQWRL